MHSRGLMRKLLLISLMLAVPLRSFAQVTEPAREEELNRAHRVMQKAGLATMGVTTALGFALLANKPTLFSDGLCEAGDPMFGELGCHGLSIVHFAFAATTLGLFAADEIVKAKMERSPYHTGDPRRDDAANALRWTNVALFAVQPVMGILATHPWLIGIPPEHRVTFSKVLRTIHFGVGVGLATTYSVQAGLQW